MLNKGKDHDFGDRTFNETLAAILVDRDPLEGPSRSLTDAEVFILQQLLQALEHEIDEHFSSNAAQSETALEKCGLFAHLRVLMLQQVSCDLQNSLFDHHVRSFLQ